MNFNYDKIANIYDELMQFIPYRQWSEYIINLFYQNGGKGENVVDLGAGTGNIAIELSKHFFKIIAIDRSFPMLRQMHFKNENLSNINCINADILNFYSKKKFNLAISIYDTANHLSENEFIAFIKNTYQLLDKGGVFIFDFNTECGLISFTDNAIVRQGKNFTSFWETNYNNRTGICTLNLKIKYEDYDENIIFNERKLNADYVEQILQQNKFENIQIYEFLKYTKIKDDSIRGMAVCMKI